MSTLARSALVFPQRSSIRGAAVAVLACVLALVLQASPAGAATAGFSVTPLRVTMNLGPGDRSTQALTIVNTLGKRATFSISKEDFSGSRTDPNASPILHGGKQASPISGYDWLSTNADTFTLNAGQTRDVTVTAHMPDTGDGGHYAAIVVSGEPVQFGSQLTARSQVAVLFLMNAAGATPPELVVKDVTTVAPGKTIVDFVNGSGNAVTPAVKYVYRDPVTGQDVGSSGGTCTTTLPGAAGRCTSQGGNAGSGTFGTRADVTLVGDPSNLPKGEGYRVTASGPTKWNASWASLLLPLAGLGLLAGYFAKVRPRLRGGATGDAL